MEVCVALKEQSIFEVGVGGGVRKVYIFFIWQGLEFDCRHGAPVNHLYLALKTQDSRDEFYTALLQLPGKFKFKFKF